MIDTDPHQCATRTGLACDSVSFVNQTGHLPRVIKGFFAASLFIIAVPTGVLMVSHGPDSRREIVDVNTYPWSSIGKIGNGAGKQCTGAVIGPNQFLTAAHCLHNALGRFVSADSMHFLLGYVGGQHRVHRIALRYVVPPTFDTSKITRRGTAGTDWAILYINESFPLDIRPLRLASVTPWPGRPVKIAGYNQRRLHMLTADQHCQINSTSANGTLFEHDCVTQRGDSGSPILSGISSEEGLIMGVHITGSENPERQGLAVSAASITEFLASQVVGSIDGRRMSKASSM